MNTPQLGSFESIRIGDIRPSTTNPRKNFDQASLEELAASIKESGLQQPIIVRPALHAADALRAKSERYEIVAGERRWRACCIAGVTQIPAIVRELSDDEAYRIQILENLQREDLGPMEEAEGYAVLTKQGLGSAEIATKVGKAPAYIHQRIKLLELGPKAQKALRAGELQLGFALELAKLPQGKDQDEAFSWCTADGWQRPRNVEQLRKQINETFRLELKKAPFSTKATNLHPTAGSCVDCTKRTSADSLLFGDIQGDDRCLDAKCFGTKVQTLVHIRLEDLKKEQGSALMVSESYYPQPGAPKGTIGSEKYSRADKPNPGCEDSELALIVEGPRIGQRLRICAKKDCKVHRPGGRDPGSVKADKKRLEEDRKARLEQKIRIRIAEELVAAVGKGSRAIDVADVLDLADYAFRRMDGTQTTRLAKMLGWEEKLLRYNGDLGRAAKLAELGAGKAAAIAVLASVAGDMAMQHQYSGPPSNKIIQLAKRNGVDVAAIRKQFVDEAKAKASKKTKSAKKAKRGESQKAFRARKLAEAKAATPAKKKAAAKKVRTMSPATRKQIAEAMRKRWAARRQKAGVK